MNKKSVMEIVSTIVAELEPLTSEERQRAVHASLTVLGEAGIKNIKGSVSDAQGDGEVDGDLPRRAQSWTKQNNLSSEQLHQIFHWGTEGVEVIASEIPGKSNREKVRNAYVILGVARLLTSGIASFEDKAARTLCENLGIYDHTNHMKYIKGGNEFTGSKDKGWMLTAPGLKQGAILVAELSKPS